MCLTDSDPKHKSLTAVSGDCNLGQRISCLSSLAQATISDQSKHRRFGTQLERCYVCRHHPLPSKPQGEAHAPAAITDGLGLNSTEGKDDITIPAANVDFDDSEGEDHTTGTTNATDEGLDLDATTNSDSYRNWKDIIPDILYAIIKSLPLADSIRFGGVCTNWYSLVAQSCLPPAPQPPFLLLPGDSTGTSDIFQFFDLSHNKFHKIRLPQLRNRHCLGSSQGNLIYLDERSELHVLDPITGSHFDLPSITTFKDIGDPEFDEDGNIIGYFFYTVPPGCLPEVYPVDHFIDNYYTKVIICPNTSAIAAISMQGLRIAFCLPGDKSWISVGAVDPINGFPIEGYEEVVFYKDAFYTITNLGHLLSFKFDGESRAIKYEVLGRRYGHNTSSHLYRYLVEADGELLLVWRFANRVHASDTDLIFAGVTSKHRRTFVTFGFEVFKMNWGTRLWEEVKSLGEYALFLGLNNSFSLSSRDFPKLKANCIYFTDDDYIARALTPRLKRDIGVFSLKDGTVEPCYPSDGDLRLNWPPPIWFTPKGLPPRRCVKMAT